MKKMGIMLLVALVVCSAVFTYSKAEDTYDASVKGAVYQKLDKDLVVELKAMGEKIKPEKSSFMNGNAHIKPADLEAIAPLDQRGMNNKGIAILVDFKDEVPGVDYDRVPVEYFNDLLNGTVYNPYELETFEWIVDGMDPSNIPLNQTMKNYYEEVSYNQYGIDVEVVDWVTLDQNYSYYMNQTDPVSNENGDARLWEMIKDAIEAADEHIDFSEYAIQAEPKEFWLQMDKDLILNGEKTDGSYYMYGDEVITEYVPNIFIIHRGTGSEYSTDPELIWSHKWDIMSAQYWGHYYETGQQYTDEEYANILEYVVADGVVVNTYNIVPEVGQDLTGYLAVEYPGYGGEGYEGREPSPAYPGVYAHEFGHVLGLPDQYDYGYDSEGTGIFTLMAGGSYGRNVTADQVKEGNLRYFTGNSPVHMDAWSKYYLGFVEPIEINENATITLNSVASEPDIFKVNVPGSDGREYFLLENRQVEGFDKGFLVNGDIHGLVIYHIVDDILIESFNRPNEAANPTANHRTKKYKDTSTGQTHYGISVLQADGQYDLEKGNNDGDVYDTFPGENQITELLSTGKYLNTNSVKMWNAGTSFTGIDFINIVEEDGVITLNVVFEVIK